MLVVLLDYFSFFGWPDGPLPVIAGLLAAGAIGFLAYKVGALTASGAIATCLIGGIVFGFGGPGAATLLILFFVSSTALSFYRRSDALKRDASEQFEKDGRRDAGQVLANGGVAAGAALLGALVPNVAVSGFMLGAYCGALATATADTWATEIGVLSRRKPRLITTLKEVEPGTSGGVTPVGTLASLAGALLIGVASIFLAMSPNIGGLRWDLTNIDVVQVAWWGHFQALPLLGASVLGGMLGSLLDSLLGATLQGSYRCPRCDKPTEKRVHGCGTPTDLVRGVAWVNNDVVNALATLAGGLVGGAVWLLLYN
jgi:uncharacterized protein (TIGR00297 family)